MNSVFLWAGLLILALPIQSEAQFNLDSGLVAYYPFNGNAEDESGNGNDGTMNGGSIGRDRFGVTNSSMELNGMGEYVMVPHNDLLNLTGDLTLSGWVYITEVPQFRTSYTLVTKRSQSSFHQFPFLLSVNYQFGLPTDYAQLLFVSANNGTYQFLGSAGDIVKTGQWVQLLSVVKDDRLALYLNGIEVLEAPTVPRDDRSNQAPLLIGSGARSDIPAEFFKGQLDDIRIYNRALTEAEVAALYELESTPPPLAADEIADIDGNRYKTVRIGEQVWMAENLRTSRYQDGTPIPNVTDGTQWSQLTTSAWSYNDNNPTNGEIYGKLYNWYAASDQRNICPVGWFVPTDEEWTVLSNYLGADAGIKLKSITGWDDNANGSNSSGFNGLPGGYRAGDFANIGSTGQFWSSTQVSSSRAWFRYLHFSFDVLGKHDDPMEHGFSIRCVRPYSSQTASSDTWTLPVRATTSGGLSSTANLGVSPLASDGLDSLDVPKPPTPPGTHIQLYTDHPEWNSPLGRRIGSDIKASVDLSAVPTSWTVYLSSSDAASGEMELDRPAELNWPIVVLQGDERHVSRSGDLVIPFNFTAGGTQSFHVHVGDTTAPGLQAGAWFEGPAILDASQTHPLNWVSGDENHLESVELSVSHDDGMTWDSLHTSVASSFDWTPSADLVFNESTRFRLTAIDRANNSTTITTQVPVSVMASRQPVSRPQGWSLSGAPLIDPDDASSTLGEAFRFAWNGTGYDQVFGFATARGQWTGAVAAITDTLGGTVAGQGQVLQLPAGWSMITAPLLRTVYGDSIRVTHSGNGRSLRLSEAVDSMWVTAPLAYVNNAYAAANRMTPFSGYWMGVLAPGVSLELPIHAYSTAVSKESAQEVPMVRLLLQDGAAEQVLSVKQGSGVPAPPAAPNAERVGLRGVPTILGELYLVAGAQMDVQSTYPLIIGGSPRDVTLSWTDQSFAGMTAVLQLTDRRYDLTRANSISLQSDESAQVIVGPISTSTDRDDQTPLRTELMAAYPNPFNPSTQIRFTLDAGRQTRLAVYDLLGREIAVLVNGNISAGSHQVTFDASGLASGVYVYRLEAGGEVFTRRMTLVK
jgi:uncharacterized protein (TIGR02145 family)